MVLTTPEGLFEPMVIFFGLIYSLVTFKAMMNELLRNLINTEKVGSLIDDMMVGIKSEEGHDELVKEILRELGEKIIYM